VDGLAESAGWSAGIDVCAPVFVLVPGGGNIRAADERMRSRFG
jgi:hypothetical protein